MPHHHCDSDSSNSYHHHSCKKRTYKTLNYPKFVSGDKTLLTGIRGVTDSNKVYISGFFVPQVQANTTSFIYKGDVYGNGKFHNLNHPPVCKMPTITNLYGPNNGSHHNTIQVVGNYTIQGNTGILGCLYEGPLNNSGKWTTIIPSALSPTDFVINTICHSTMGNLVVGNYDTQLIQGKAFIYDIKKHKYYDITNSDAISITAYGIWYNGGCSYTICGGYTSNALKNVGYIVDWDNKTHTFKNWQTYYYDNDQCKAQVTHFDGITVGPTKNTYNLTGDWKDSDSPYELAFIAQVKRDCDGKFYENAKWGNIEYPCDVTTSGNSIYKKTVIGVYTTAQNNSVNGYISNIKDC